MTYTEALQNGMETVHRFCPPVEIIYESSSDENSLHLVDTHFCKLKALTNYVDLKANTFTL